MACIHVAHRDRCDISSASAAVFAASADRMNIMLPAGAMYDLASTTGSIVRDFALPAELSLGIFVAFFVIQFLFDAIAARYWPIREDDE